jgi:DNA-directed RNA polymerase I, II, and III subunit RPABC2
MATDIVTLNDIKTQYNPSLNVTRNIITRYEKAKIIGMRMEQLARDAYPMVDTHDCNSVHDIAMKELEERKIPFIIVRTLANGKKEYWKIEDLIII